MLTKSFGFHVSIQNGYRQITDLLESYQTAPETVSLQSLDILTPNFVCAIVTLIYVEKTTFSNSS